MTRVVAAAILCLVTCTQTARAQQEFEVASVRPSPPPDGRGMTVGCRGGPGSDDPGMVSCANVSLTMLVTMAYNLGIHELIAPDWMTAPDWTTGQKFDITARVPAGATKAQLAEMWQRLLMDRFKLMVHREARDLAKYELLVAKAGPKFKESVDNPPPGAASEETSHSRGPQKVDKGGFPELARPGMIGMNGRIRLYQTKMTMEKLAIVLAGQLGRPVTDNTGLKGEYDIRLYWGGRR
jgi:uncharacterized protein (TIGR03435 family)